ncbi:pyruvate kinase alpha/beta domain-containing protein [Escherichia coli]
MRKKIPSINVSKHRLDVQFDNVEEAIAMSAMYAANHLKGVTAIITMTESGRTALMTSPYQLWSANFSPCRAMNVR